MFMVLSSWQSHCESSPGSLNLMNVERRQAAAEQRLNPDSFGCESAGTGYQSPHPPSPFILITQPES